LILGDLFGTDGIRGVANEYPITSEMAVDIGRAVGSYFKGTDGKSKIIIGKDTRISGPMIEYAIVSGICSMGGDAYLTGILPTPGIALLTTLTGANAGIVISASHNPFYDNGIKLFDQGGYKLSDAKEAEIEALILKSEIASKCRGIRETGRVYQKKDAGKKYTAFLKDTLSKGCSFKGLKIVIDCSNGATYRVAPELFEDLGAQIEAMFINPDGKNINADCGSQHPGALARKVVENNADIGLAFDGDGDRLIVADEKGNIIRGDQILAICARDMQQKGVLKNNTLVSTIMSNMGLGVALQDMGITHVKANVGDRYVLEKMLTIGAVLGGEDSGHMVFLDQHTTGDGILAALRLIEALQAEAKPLSELSQIMTVFPQVLLNVDVKRKPEITDVPEIAEVIRAVEARLGAKGRVLVRYSGTQPLCRVMVEGPALEEVNRYCQQIADVVEDNLG
jgi:phosphoglucosamine mutase